MKKKLGILLLSMTMMLATMAGCGNGDTAGGGDTGAGDAPAATTDGGDAGAGDTATGESFKVGFALKTQDSPYFVALGNAVKQYTSELGWDCTVLDANGDIMKESENMDTFITQGMDLIFLDAIEPDACIPKINEAAAAGIPVINLDSGVGEADDVTTVYSDNLQNGRKVGLAYAEKMGDTPIKAIILSGAKGNIAGQERRTGLFCGIIEGKAGISEDEAWTRANAFEDMLTSTGKATDECGLEVVGQGWGDWTEELGLTASEDLITANMDINCVMGENDQMLFGAMTALENAGLTEGVDIVAAADGAQRAYDLIKEGKYFATGENSPWMVARTGVDIAKEILVDGKSWDSFEKITLTEAIAVTADNVDSRYEYGF